MGHDITAITGDGKRIEGPHFTHYWFPHYDIFDAWKHNDGVSGNGGSEPMTPERLQRARQVCLERLESSQESMNEIEEEIRNTPQPTVSPVPPRRSTSGKPKFFLLVPGDPDDHSHESEHGEPAPRLVRLRNLLDPSDWDDDEPTPPKERLRYARSEVNVYRDILSFIDRCLAEDAVKIEFW